VDRLSDPIVRRVEPEADVLGSTAPRPDGQMNPRSRPLAQGRSARFHTCCVGTSRPGRALWLAVISIGALALASGLAPVALQAQEPSIASAFLPVDHWSHTALQRLHAVGLLPAGFDPATRSVSRADALVRLRYAVVTAQARAPQWQPLAEGYLARLVEEFPRTAEVVLDGGRGPTLEGRIAGGVHASRNQLLARHEPDAGAPSRTVALSDANRPTGGLEAGFLLPGNRLSLGGETRIEARGGTVRAQEAYGVTRLGPVGLWGGRRTLALGASDAGSLVLGPGRSFDGGGLFLADGMELPGFLATIGMIRYEGFLARVSHTGQVASPWFIGMRGSLSPHPRLTLGINRGVFFGGDAELVPPVTADRLLKVLVGIDTADEGAPNFENHTASMEVWFAPPLGGIPFVLYGEWAVQDLQAQRTDMPAFLIGGRVEGLPSATWLRIGFERTTFSQPPGGIRPWYDHRVFGTWTDGGHLLGHPLAGVGRESRLYGNADLLEARLRLEGRFHTRRRTADNLLAPEREGSSRGLEGIARWRVRPSVDLELRGTGEWGDGWDASSGMLSARYRF
jgi:hypothetical protein